MITPVLNDHVRFSLVGECVIIILSLLMHQQKKQNKAAAWVLLIITLWLILFLHVLAARTGLLSFYVFVFFIILWLIFKKAKPLYAMLLFTVLFHFPGCLFRIAYFSKQGKIFFTQPGYFKDAHYLQDRTMQ
jgi:O-antigen ligase